MEIILDNPDKWYKKYKRLKDENKYKYVMETLDSEMPDKFFDDIDIISIITSTFEYLKRTKQHEKNVELYDRTIRWKEDKEWYYIDKYMIDYCLYNSDMAGVKKHLESFLSNPVESIEIFILVLDKLVYYGHTDLVYDISLQMYSKVKGAPGLIAGVEYEFGDRIYNEKLLSIYTDLKTNIPVEEAAIIKFYKEYGYDIKDDMEIILDVLSPDYKKKPDYNDYKTDKSYFVFALMLVFFRYMYEVKNISFSAAYDIWDVVIDSIKRGSPGNTKDAVFNNFFKLDREKYDYEISGRMGFISNKFVCGFAVAWGSAYVYDFLFMHKYISEKVYYNAIDIIDSIKAEIITGNFNSLWEYNFVHMWGKPDSMEDKDFQVEKELFNDSYNSEIELVDQQTFNRLIEED